jgi:sugar phosphate isomerase/epimerase
MAFPVALQLYSLREQIGQDYEGVVRRVASMGYDGVEPAGFPGTTAQAAGWLFRELGLKVPCAHIFPPPTGDRLHETVETLAAIGCRRLVSGFGPDAFKDLAATQRSCDTLNQAYREASAQGLALAVHNHWWEYLQVEGQYPYQVLARELDPAIQFEVDTYWVKTAGCDPAAVLVELGPRATLLHIKDGPAVRDQPMTAVGTGVMDVPALLAAARGNAEWLIVEIDRCATDMFTAVDESLKYLRKVQG